MKYLFACAILLAAVSPVAAQSSVVMPERLSAEQTSVRNAYLVLRDSLHAIEAGGARLVRDMKGTSDATLSSRARVIGRGCGVALGMLDSARVRMMAMESAGPRAEERRANLSDYFPDLADGLEECRSGFTRMAEPDNSKELRGYGVSRSDDVRAIIREFNRLSREYFILLGIEIRPIGAGANPLAG